MSLMDKKPMSLAHAWKSYTEAVIKSGVDSPVASSLFWAFDEMVDKVRDQPFDALEIIQEILKVAEDDRILANLAAGPLEDLLVDHGTVVVDRVIELALADPKFRNLLQGVWGNSIDERVWKRIEDLYKASSPKSKDPASQ